MTDFRHCEFRHLLVRVSLPAPFPAYYGHAHEDEALHCASMTALGWPDARLTGDDDA